MLRESSRQQAINLDSDSDVEVSSPAVRKVDFSKTSRKKVQTPKKKATFTPLRKVLDIKPNVEAESPTRPTRLTKGPASRKQDPQLPGARTTQEPEDVKPDVDNLDELLGGLTIQRSRTPDSPLQVPVVKAEMEPWTPAARKPVASSSTPLFMPYDTPATPAPRHPAFSRNESANVAPAPSALDLFSDDSPPVKRETWSPVPSPSRSSARSRSAFPAVSEQDSPSVRISRSPSPERQSSFDLPIMSNPVAGPSRTQTPGKRRAFLDFLAKVDGDESEDEEGIYDHDLSGSMGSLRDFIADDDEVDYQSGDNGTGLDSDIESCASDDNGATRMPKFELNSDGEIYEATTHAPKIERDGSGSDSDIEIVEEEAISRPKAGASAKPTLLAEFIDSDDDDILETSDVDDDLLSAVDKLHLEAKVSSSSKTKGKKPTKAPKWAMERVRIAQEVFDDLDKRVFEGRLGESGAGAKIVWNKRLLTTAGTAHRKKRRHPDGTTTFEVGIQLSDKVCTGEEQILSTVAHEMCHLACWVIDNEFKNPHGKVFKSWGRKVMRKRDDLEVTTRHDYVIEYKYKWHCVGCRKVYKRHSKSIDIEKQGCGICKNKLEPMFETKQRASNTFQIYLKENMATAKASLPGASHGDVMRALSARWAEAGPEADHQAHWKAVLAASRS